MGLELSLGPADATDHFGSSQFRMESVPYPEAREKASALLRTSDVHASVPADSVQLHDQRIEAYFYSPPLGLKENVIWTKFDTMENVLN